jgi:iron complex outermembrane receptor protein
MSKNDSQFLPRFSADFRLTPENMVYASVAKGWRPGGIYPNAIPNSNPFVLAPPLTEGDLRYKRETSWTYELGTKNEFFDKRLLLNAAVFYTVYKDFQDRYQDSWLSSFLRNADEARMAGFEVEAEGRITDGLTASLAFGYTHARYEDYKDDANDFSGNTVAFVPEYNGSFAVKYAFLDGFYVRPEVRLTGESYWDRENRHSQDAYLTLHARAGYAAEHWEVYVYGDNLTNKYAFTHAEDALGTGEMYGSPIRPLTVGVGFSVTF